MGEVAFLYTFPYSTDRRPRDDREKSESTFCQNFTKILTKSVTKPLYNISATDRITIVPY